ncbi:hypothetical protein SASPL_115266 [Salvia splendens]|uniref:CSC1-like protein At3g54510 n=1 Tax=Salvia splendens TaxID=180675 RepID=A0A8X8Y815_SALSN|nr:hypothetical protein SASPL_115266 [Salvia splendens]
MNAESLLVSASINIGFALLILSLFSILQKQPSNAPIYYARRLSQHRPVSLHPRLSVRRLLPSPAWIRLALSITEDEILDTCGLDVLIFIRLFKFGINFFLVGSLVGLFVLVPINYLTGDGKQAGHSHSLDAFTITNITKGSDWLWVHCACLYFISFYGLYLLHKEYEAILVKRIQQLHLMRHEPNQLTVLVREIPFCEEHNAHDCAVDHFFSKYHPHSYQSYQILYDGRELDKLLNQSKSVRKKIEKLRHRSANKKQSMNLLESEALRNDVEIERLKEQLRDIGYKIQFIQTKDQLQAKELPVAFVTFKSRWGAALAAQSQQTSNPIIWVTEMAPEPRDVLWKNLAIPFRYMPLYKFGVYVSVTVLTIFFAVPVTAVQGIAKFERLKKWFPPAMAVQLIPGLSSFVTGYLPSAILNGFVYIVPFAIIEMAKIAGYVSRSRKDIKACNMVFYFLVGNVFFLSLLSGSLIDQIGEYFNNPRDFPGRLASAATAQADFFMTYILTNGLSGFSLEILQPGLLIWEVMRSHIWDRGKKTRPYLTSLPYYRTIPFVSLCMLIGMVYAVVSPLLLPFLVGYFCLGYVVFKMYNDDRWGIENDDCCLFQTTDHEEVLVRIFFQQGTISTKRITSAKYSILKSSPPLLYRIFFKQEKCEDVFAPHSHFISAQVQVEVATLLRFKGRYRDSIVDGLSFVSLVANQRATSAVLFSYLPTYGGAP